MPRVLVIGGGVAGLAAAVDLSLKGFPVVLLEAGRALGGRAASGELPGFGEVDLGFHVLMRTCTQARRFLGLLGGRGDLLFQHRLEVPLWVGGKILWVRSYPLLHLLPSLWRFPGLSPKEKAALIRLLFALRRPPDIPAGEWFRRLRLPRKAVEFLLDPLIISALNGEADKVSAPYAALVLRRALLSPWGGALIFFRTPMSRIWSRAIPILERAGGEVRLGARAAEILIHHGRAGGVRLAGGEEIAGDAVIAALPPYALEGILPRGKGWFLMPARGIPWSPIVCVHFLFPKQVLPLPFLFAPGRPLQAVFSVSRIQGKSGPEHVVVVQSAARAWIGRPLERVREELLEALGEIAPRSRGTRPLHAYVLRFPRATFLPAPGIEGLRPRITTPIQGLYLAGDTVGTGWPSTLEGAVRSGLMAAHAVAAWLRSINIGRRRGNGAQGRGGDR